MTAAKNKEAKGARATDAAEERADNKGSKSSVKRPHADLRALRSGTAEERTSSFKGGCLKGQHSYSSSTAASHKPATLSEPPLSLIVYLPEGGIEKRGSAEEPSEEDGETDLGVNFQPLKKRRCGQVDPQHCS